MASLVQRTWKYRGEIAVLCGCVGGYFAWDKLDCRNDRRDGDSERSLKLRVSLPSVQASTAIYIEKSIEQGDQRPKRKRAIGADELAKATKLTSRERRFIRFSSVEFHGQLYMTPQDFLESVTEPEPRPRLKRRVLSPRDLELIAERTPLLKDGKESRLFRSTHDKGIISYTEYLFLLSILTKPRSGFLIAFNMFDTDGDQTVDKSEFLVLEKIFSHTQHERQENPDMSDEERTKSKQIAEMLQRSSGVDTTLLLYFFGKEGQETITYNDFERFMEQLQTEILEMEFSEFSKGKDHITEMEFAKILMRYTALTEEESDLVYERLLTRITDERGISFAEFKGFCQFLNNLEDFAIAMKMYTLANQPISQGEFLRAVKICTGETLSDHLVNTVFMIFDEDGDGQLSYTEFIAIMKDRLHRGFRHNFLQDTCPDNSDSPCYGGYDAIKALFNNIRQKENNVVNLNAGDNLDIHNTRWCGHYNSTVATHFGNKMEWDAVVMGNHEMDIDERHTEQYLRDANFTVLAANMVAGNNSDMKERFQPYTILERSGRKIGVIGYVINVTCYYEYWSNWWLVPPKHVTFGCQTHAVHKVAEELTRQGVDIIIALGHTGYIEYDLELARSVPNIDLVVGGHSHTFLWDGQWVASPSDAEEYVRGSYPHVVENELTGQKVLVVHCYKWGKYACELNLRFNEDGIPVEWSGVPHLLSEDSPRVSRKVVLNGDQSETYPVHNKLSNEDEN
ncbi:unnamed protein product [Cyprideis torosa]|uniref:Uncharacterized protein n=1 Tax=Cyprideis torosa TaxID=163714 RepID=A0A7R8W5D5_9CRUS|nr:unnamed protein product [Cyprideis torosa]CAG0879741.1 unnamed protein product [Cyprideis torosa]